MKESASIALDYMKANAAKYGLSKEDFENQDIHIHVPEGAVKKDGPSAGVTLTTALYSSFTKKAVKNDVAMTGEITLTGEVLPIGGLKEKSISAHRSGISTIIIPKDNEKDIDDIPESVKKELTIIVADHIDTVLKHAIV
jgi:ATP-dependent Lon protease